MIFTLVWLLGMLFALGFWGYLKGHADARFRENKGLTENPPFIIGMLTAPFWPAQIIFGLIWAIVFFSTRAGADNGFEVNQELSQLRKFAGDFRREEARTYALLMANNVDPGSIDDQTKRALTARSIEWAMQDEAQIKREQAGLPVVRTTKSTPTPKDPVLTDGMFDILDKAGVTVKSEDYDDYHERTKGPLDL